jgi:hypothetical protein
LQRGCRPAAIKGEVKSAQLALKIIVARAKLLGLDQIPEDAQPQTLVIGGSSEEYIAGLKLLIAGTESTLTDVDVTSIVDAKWSAGLSRSIGCWSE